MIDGYYGYHSGRENRRGGGISIFVKKNADVKVVPLFSESLPEIEFVHINIFYGGTSNVNILAIYRPPNQNMIDDFVMKLGNNFCRINI